METPADLIARTEKGFRDAVRLARVVSIASRIEPELLRQARLRLLPAVDAGAEADLWFSPLVQASTPMSLTLFPAVATQLRRELAQTPSTLSSAWLLLEEVHRDAPAAIRLEERVTWEILSARPGALQRVQDELMSVVSAINIEKRSGLARWALRAVPRLPEEARQTEAATRLLLTAATHLKAWHLLEKQIESNSLSADFINQLQVVLPVDLPKIPVGVRLLEDLREGGSSERKFLIEFSEPPSTDLKDVINVPGTTPLMIEVSWGDSATQEIRNVNLYQGRTETIAIGTSHTITIRTAAGDIYTLSEDKEQLVSVTPNAPTSALDRIPSRPSIGYVPRYFKSGLVIVQTLTKRLSPDVTRIVQIIGPAGTGKTTVAAEVARRLLDTYRQRVVWLSAAGRSDFSFNSLLDGIATQLFRSDIRTLEMRSKTREVKSLLSNDIALVVVDDFENIRIKERTRCLNFLNNHGCATVIVSRATTRRSSTKDVIVLGAMTQDEANTFLNRTLDLEPRTWKFFGSDLPVKVFSVCEGNPLAMQLLLAQIAFVRVASSALEELSRGEGTVLDRVFNLSFNLPELEDDGRAVLLATALFVPSASKEALAQVAPLGGNLERLNMATERLIRLKLAYEVGDDNRLAVEGFIRETLEGRLSKTDASDSRLRFVSYFLSYVQRHSGSTAADYDALEAEFDNLIDAMDMAEDANLREELIQICIALAEFFDVRGYWDEALRRNAQAQRVARRSGQQDQLPALNQAAGYIYLRRLQFAKAEAAFNSVLKYYANQPVNAEVAIATRHLGSIALQQENLERAERFYSEALDISRQLGFASSVADNVHNLAIVKQEQGDLNEARRLYQESLDLSGSLNDDRSHAISLHQLGVIAMKTAKYSEAEECFHRSLAIKRELQDRLGTADTLHQLGLLFRAQGRNADAEAVLRDAFGIFSQLSSPSASEVEEDLDTLLDVSLQAQPFFAPSTGGSSKAAGKQRVTTTRPKTVGGGRTYRNKRGNGGFDGGPSSGRAFK